MFLREFTLAHRLLATRCSDLALAFRPLMSGCRTLFPLIGHPALFLCGRSVLCRASTFMSSFLTLLSRRERVGLGLLAMSSRFPSKSLAFAPPVLRGPTREEHRDGDHDHGADDDQDYCECAHPLPPEQSAKSWLTRFARFLFFPLRATHYPRADRGNHAGFVSPCRRGRTARRR